MSLTSIKYNISLFLLLFLFFQTRIQAQATLSDQAEISILTCSKGDDLYNAFGHTAIHIKDLPNNINIVFNYGMFSFGGNDVLDQLNFGVKFIRGKLEYWLGVGDYNDFIGSYTRQERWVFEQILNLSPGEKQGLFNALVINYEPKNRAYRYDFFFDNCSSRIRDILVDAVGPLFGDDKSSIHEKTSESFIDLINPYIKEKPWLDLGMDIMLGLPSSRKASKYEFMFLPYHLKEQISLADGLVSSEKYIIEFPYRNEEKKEFQFFTPFKLFSLLFVFVAFISYRNYKKGTHWFWLDRLLILLSGLLGSLFLFMWLGTDHLPAHANLNMFWAFPINIIAFIFIKNKKWQLYFKFVAGLSAFVILAWFISPQQYHIAIAPLVGVYILRYLKLSDHKEA